MIIFSVHRDGSGDLEHRIKMALAAFYKEHDAWPETITVPSSEFDQVLVIVADLGVDVEVLASGGCLVPEVWLQKVIPPDTLTLSAILSQLAISH